MRKGWAEEVNGECHPLGPVLGVSIFHAAELLLQAADAIPLLLDQRSQCSQLLHHLLQLPSLLQGHEQGQGFRSCSPPQIYYQAEGA